MNNIAEFRRKKGLSQEELAEILGISRVAMSNYERDIVGKPNHILLDAIAKELGTTVDELDYKAEGEMDNEQRKSR